MCLPGVRTPDLFGMKSPQRVFLDWRQPALVSAVQWLRHNFGPATPQTAKNRNPGQRQFSFDEPVTSPGGAAWDLSQVIVVVPGKRAGRRLLELLCFEARD